MIFRVRGGRVAPMRCKFSCELCETLLERLLGIHNDLNHQYSFMRSYCTRAYYPLRNRVMLAKIFTFSQFLSTVSHDENFE